METEPRFNGEVWFSGWRRTVMGEKKSRTKIGPLIALSFGVSVLGVLH